MHPYRCKSILLAFPLRDDKDSSTARKHEFPVNFVFSAYNRDIDHVVAVVGIDEISNQVYGRCIGPTTVACHSHRYTVAVFVHFDDCQHVIAKVSFLMRRISFQMPSAKLRRTATLAI